jgi:hypothetical protein
MALAGLDFRFRTKLLSYVPTCIKADNKSALAIASHPEYHAPTKHIDIQYYYVREKAQDGTMMFHYVSTAQMAADEHSFTYKYLAIFLLKIYYNGLASSNIRSQERSHEFLFQPL